ETDSLRVADRRFSENTAIVLLSQLVRYGLMTVAWVMIARIAGARGLGQIQLAYAFTSWMALFINLGVPVANIYFIGRRIYPASAVIGNCLLFAITQTIFAITALWGARHFIIKFIPLSAELYGPVLVWVPLQLLVTNLSSIL